MVVIEELLGDTPFAQVNCLMADAIFIQRWGLLANPALMRSSTSIVSKDVDKVLPVARAREAD